MSAASAFVVRRAGFLRAALPCRHFSRRTARSGRSASTTRRRCRATLEELVDFDLINRDAASGFRVGAVNVRTGNSVYFDNSRRRKIGAEHIMASGALPPGFPPVEIEGELYWDGGIVSNSPLWYVLDDEPADRMR